MTERPTSRMYRTPLNPSSSATTPPLFSRSYVRFPMGPRPSPISFRVFSASRSISSRDRSVRIRRQFLKRNAKLGEFNEILQIHDHSRAIRDTILKIGKVLGLFNEPEAVYFEKKKSAAAQKSDIDPAEIDKLIEERLAARKAKDFARADEIRDQLAEKNIILKDMPDGTTTWKFQ